MAYDPRSSFGQAPGVVPTYVRKQRTIQVYRVLAGVMSTCAVVASIGVFLYKDFSKNELETAKAELKVASAEDTGNQKKIAELQAYDLKLTIARTLLDEHLAPSRIFEELEQSVKETVTFKQFEYSYEPGLDAMLSLVGNTSELDSVFLQKRQFFKEDLFSEFVVSDVTLIPEVDETAKEAVASGVDFSVEGIFNKGYIKYQGEVAGETETVVTEETQGTSTEIGTLPTSESTTDVPVSDETNDVIP